MSIRKIISTELKSKINDDDYDILHPVTTSGNVKTSEEIEVMLPSAIGSYNPGDKIAKGTTIDDIIKKLLQVRIPPTYIAPTVTLTVSDGAGGGSYEIGTPLTPSFRSTFTQNDAGQLTKHQILKDGVEITNNTNTTLSVTESIIIGSSNIIYSSKASYSSGPIKNDNFGEKYLLTSIKAGSKVSSDITYSSYRSYFYGSGLTSTPTKSTDIRGLTNGGAASQGKTFTLVMSAGDKICSFAYPASIRDVSSVKYVESGNDESKDLFTKTSISVEGVNGYTAVDYKVYSLVLNQPIIAAMTFKVTI